MEGLNKMWCPVCCNGDGDVRGRKRFWVFGQRKKIMTHILLMEAVTESTHTKRCRKTKKCADEWVVEARDFRT